MLEKLNKKIFLNALILVITALIALFSSVLSGFSNDVSNCNNDLQSMLINKTQQYVEKQEILIDGAIDVSNRAAYIVKGDQEAVGAYTDRIGSSSQQYKLFTDSMKNYDSNIRSKKNDCVAMSKTVTFLTSLITALSAILVVLSALYLKKY